MWPRIATPQTSSFIGFVTCLFSTITKPAIRPRSPFCSIAGGRVHPPSLGGVWPQSESTQAVPVPLCRRFLASLQGNGEQQPFTDGRQILHRSRLVQSHTMRDLSHVRAVFAFHLSNSFLGGEYTIVRANVDRMRHGGCSSVDGEQSPAIDGSGRSKIGGSEDLAYFRAREP